MAFSCNQSAPVGHLVDAFRHHNAKNPDGWGVAFYNDRAAAVFKEPVSAEKSKLAEFLATYPDLNARLMIAHVRKAAVGGVQMQNTHPFVRELGGKEYVLAHNGVLKDYENRLPLGRFRPLGINDSEFLLCYLLGEIDRKGIAQWNAESFAWLQDVLRRVNDFGSLNCVFSDGTYLFAYRDKRRFSSLGYAAHHGRGGATLFPDLSRRIELDKLYPKSAACVLIATKPITDEQWTPIPPGRLCVFKDGVGVYSGDAAPCDSVTVHGMQIFY